MEEGESGSSGDNEVMRSAQVTTIVELYENSGLSVSEIAATQEVEKPLVLSTLLNFSQKFRDECKSKEANGVDEDIVSKDELREFLGEYKAIARYTEDQHLKAKCLKDLINVGLKVTDGLGAVDAKKLLKQVGGSGNIYNLNMVIQQARAAKARVLDKVSEVLDVEHEEVKTA